jgi:hypothetical protein
MAISTDELTFTTKKSLRSGGNAAGSQILHQISSPSDARHVQNFIDEGAKQQELTPDEALTWLMLENLTKE